jgi:hypothetical protein
MAPKRRRDAVAKEISKTYTFGRSLIDGGDIASLQKNRMVGTARVPGRETVPKPQENKVVIFQDLLFAGLGFLLHPVVVDILRYFDIYLHQLTPNAILRLSVYMWICGTTKIKPSTEGFASAHQVHHQRRTVFEEEGDYTVEKDCQFGCLNFSYKTSVVSPVTAYRNKWPSDWQQHWLYHTVTPLAPGEPHPLSTRELPPLHDSYTKNPSCPKGDKFIMMLRRFTHKYNTRDIVEKYHSIPVCPLLDGWAVAKDASAADIGGIPCPDWMKVLASPWCVSFASFSDPSNRCKLRMLPRFYLTLASTC